jgi:hypothetical protein
LAQSLSNRQENQLPREKLKQKDKNKIRNLRELVEEI